LQVSDVLLAPALKTVPEAVTPECAVSGQLTLAGGGGDVKAGKLHVVRTWFDQQTDEI
jgi:hypothetical protein